MSNYTIRDFSPIFSAKIKPEKIGWYAATAGHKGLLVINKLTPSRFYYWDGEKWRGKKDSVFSIYFPINYWFGLRKKHDTR